MKLNKPQTDKQLRDFGIVMSLAFTVFAGISFWKWKFVTKLCLTMILLATVMLPLALFAPRTLAKPERAWMIFGEKIGNVMTLVIMTLTYVVLVVPIGLFLRLTGKDLLSLKIDKSKKSYWVPVEKDGPGTRFFLPY